MQGVVVRWLALGATLSLFSGCPRECEAPDGEVALVAVEEDSTFGVFEGPLEWLQTADQSNLRITITRDAESATRSCDYAQVGATYKLQTSDGSVTGSKNAMISVTTDGVALAPSQSLVIDASGLLDAGKLPDAPGIEDRNPRATLTLEQTAEGLSATISVRSNTDQLTAALGTLSRVP